MRNFIDIIDSPQMVTEGVGLANRKPGELFSNPAGDTITFQGLNFYPASGKFPSGDAMKAAVDDLAKQGTNIHWVNSAAANTGGFMIASFASENGDPYYLGKWVKEISPNRVQNNFAHSDIPGGFKYQSRAGQKENSGLKPSQWLKQFQNNTPQTILKQCQDHFGVDSAESRALAEFINSDVPVTVPAGNMNPAAFRDYFAEVLQPIALVMGKNVSGNAAEAASIFFGPGQDFSKCTISFNNNTIGGLYDSLLVNPDGKQIKLSSKGKDGASASVTNLQKSVAELSAVPAGKKLLDKYKEEIDILETIQKEGHFGAPLKLAVQYKMITPQEATQVLKLKNLGPQDEIVGSGILSKKLEKMYQARQAKDVGRIIPIEHMISAIAYPLAKYINENTNFSQAASDILNNAALVQMYTDTKASGDSITVTKLTAVYPSQTVTGVLLDPSKVYFSTGGKGNYTFTILKNGATAKDVNPADGMDSLEAKPTVDVTEPEQLDVATQRRSAVKAAPAPEKLGTKQSLGRQRQR